MGRCIAADPSCMRLHSRCSGATFRLPSVLTRFINSCLPDFLLPCYASVCSGGLDSILLQWDFNTGKQLQAFDMGEAHYSFQYPGYSLYLSHPFSQGAP